MEHRTSDTPQETPIVPLLQMSQREMVARFALEKVNHTVRELEAQTGDLVLHSCAYFLRRAAVILELVARDERHYRTSA